MFLVLNEDKRGKEKDLLGFSTRDVMPKHVLGRVTLVPLEAFDRSEERAKVVDFSDSYAWGGSDVLVMQGSPVKALN